jgi:hypothetical protein
MWIGSWNTTEKSSMRRSASPETADDNAIQTPWWKRLLCGLMPQSERTSVPPRITVFFEAAQTFSEPVGIWVPDRSPHDLFQEPLSLVYNTVKGSFAVGVLSSTGWLFWTGPEKNLFTRPGDGPVWTTKDRQEAVIAARDIVFRQGVVHSH